MSDAIEILVIGTDPPCPRCDLIGLLIEKVSAEADIQVNIRHSAYDSQQAVDFGHTVDHKVGTAKHVAQTAGIKMDWDAVYGVIADKKASQPPNSRPAEAWTEELDRLLMPCADAADDAGYLMTPILIMNGNVVHHGSVPKENQIAAWLSNQITPDETNRR
jgi:hypothetical protein